MFSCAYSNLYNLGIVEILGHWFMLIHIVFYSSVLVFLFVCFVFLSYNQHNILNNSTCYYESLPLLFPHSTLVHTTKGALTILQLYELSHIWYECLDDKDIVRFTSHFCSTPVHGMFSAMLIEWISGHKNTIYLFRQEVDGNSSLGYVRR